jgi:uncharacterized cupredoxin-like copper-binding protein
MTPMRRALVRNALAVGAVAVGLLVTGCGSNSGSGSNSSSPPATTGGANPPAANGTKVAVTEKDFSITMSLKAFHPGAYTFEITNSGPASHNLNVMGPGVDSQVSPTLAAGSTGSLTVTLQKGSYEFWCSVDSHRNEGMDMTVQVS